MRNLFKKITIQQVLILLAVGVMLYDIFVLKYFLSGLLGAVTLFVVTRKFYLKLVEERNWKNNLAIIFIFVLLIISFGIPLWILIDILVPKINELISDREAIIEKFQSVRVFLENNEFLQRFDFTVTNEQIVQMVNKVISYIPSTLNAVGQIFANIFVALFILYYMLLNTRSMEADFKEMLPISEKSKKYFIHENAALIRSNAYGIPILAFAQAIIAIIGYLIFGVNNAIFWGLLTGAASIIPVVGTMIVWVPICIYQIATGDVNSGLLLGLYCLILVGSIDNILRFTVLKKMADIHPLITVFGVLLGLSLFGVMGLVFGPVLLSLPGILYKIFKIEKGESISEGEEKDKAEGERDSASLTENINPETTSI
ncbi:MAG: AI-2E family transporter [Kaistella sp.]